MRPVFGGVVFNDKGKTLLVKPSNSHRGTVWTLAKGERDTGETPEQTALRAVLEETGYRCEIVAPLPGEYEGEATVTKYFLMRAVEQVGEPERETEKVEWVQPDEAKVLLSKTTKKSGRERDLAVLLSAIELVECEDGSDVIATVVLQDKRSDDGLLHLHAELRQNGDLAFVGHDLGKTVKGFFGCDECEWEHTVKAEHVPLFRTALGCTGDLLRSISRKFRGNRSANIDKFMESNDIPFDTWNWVSD